MFAGALWAAWRWRLLLPVTAALLPALASHFSIKTVEYTNFYLMLALAGVCLADLHVCLASAAFRLPRFKFRVRIGLPIGIALLALSFASLAGMLPGHRHTEMGRNEYLFTEHPYLPAYRLLSRLPPERVQSVLVDVQDVATSTGQYYYLHHDVGVYFPWAYAEHRQLVDSGGIRQGMTHVITYVPQCFSGFDVIGRAGDLVIMENDNAAAVVPPAHPERLLKFFSIELELLRYFGQNVKLYRQWIAICSRG